MEVEEQAEASRGGPAVIAALRDATRRHHAQIEERFQLGSNFGLAHYHRALIAFASFLAAWEPRLAQALPPHRRDWFQARSRLGLLRLDLAALGLREPAPSASLDIPLSMPGAAWGSLYVVEGSALGGQLIAAHLRKGHGIGVHNGGAFFHGRGPATAALWRDFLQQLSQAVQGPREQASACRAAQETFESLGTAWEAAA